MIQIEDLIIELPAQFRDRANHIARLVREKSRHLGGDLQTSSLNRRIDTMVLADIETTVQANDNAIAEQIVARLGQSLKKRG